MPACTSITHHEVAFVALFAQATFVSFFCVCVEALLAQPFSVLVPESLCKCFNWAKPFCAVFALYTIIAEPCMGGDCFHLGSEAMDVDRLIAHLADNHLGLVLCSLAFFAHLTCRAVPAEPLDEVTLQLWLNALPMPEVLARCALQSIVGISHCSNSLGAILASVQVIVDGLGWLLGRCSLLRTLES